MLGDVGFARFGRGDVARTGRGGARDPDPVAAHDEGLGPPVLVHERGAHGLAVDGSELEDVTSRAEVVDAAKLTGDKVTFGTTVRVADEDTDEESTYHIVGPYEADISIGLVSTSSPIARGLIGKTVGDSAEVQTPGGIKSYEIISIGLFDMSKVGKG